MTIGARALAYAQDYAARTGRKPTLQQTAKALGTHANAVDSAARRAGLLVLFDVRRNGGRFTGADAKPASTRGLKRKARFWQGVVRQIYSERYRHD